MDQYQHQVDVVTSAALEAGRLLLDEFHREGGPRGTRGKCPADVEAEAVIRRRLREAFPEYGLKGEELPHEDQPAVDADTHVWSIDPNDGTTNFQRGWRGTSVSIGLLRGGQPVLGVVFAYGARAGRGDLLTWAEGEPISRNGVSCETGQAMPREQGAILVSTSGDSKPEAYSRLCSPARFRSVPSIAYRLALVAAGDALGTYSFSGPSAWDVAAGHALLQAAKGQLLRMDGTPVTYDRDGIARVGNCCGATGDLAAEMVRRDYSGVFHPRRSPVGDYGLATPSPERLVRDPSVLDRAQGCLLGQLAGDNLGALVEFQEPERIRQLFPAGVREMVDGGHWQLLAGQPTDDSELAVMLARSILKESRYSAEAAARAYAWWYGSDPFDVGTTTSRALAPAWAALRSGGPVAAAAERAAQGSHSQSNGALMRVSPLAIFGFSRDDNELATWAREDARLTHAHPVCQDASAVYCVAIAAAIRLGLDRQTTYEYACQWARTRGVQDDVLTALETARAAPPRDFITHMGWVLIAFQNAFYQLLHVPTLSEAVAATIAAGGDTDTNAAIAGALFGAIRGAEAVPARWTDRILTCRPQPGMPTCQHPRPPAFWPVDCLIVAEQLASLGARLA